MSGSSSATLTQWLQQLEQAYRKQAWHGPNLRGTLRGVSVEVASWRPETDRHNIWELALHCAYWKYAAWRRITGGKRGSFPLEGSNWFSRPPTPPQPASRAVATALGARWKADLAILGDCHKQLLDAVGAINPRRLHGPSAKGSSTSLADLVFGVAAHDLYHAGQISLLKRLHDSSPGSRSLVPRNKAESATNT